jgi:hypothetical protein
MTYISSSSVKLADPVLAEEWEKFAMGRLSGRISPTDGPEGESNWSSSSHGCGYGGDGGGILCISR